jgi:hypothetical protein
MSETTDWQPIKTAPKDGTTILVFRPEATGQYIPLVGSDYFDPTYNGGRWMRSNPDTRPTHWMPLPEPPGAETITEYQIKFMVDRFLGWKLPENFNPDDGISFEPIAGKNGPAPFRRTPVGTNLFSAEQADAMVRYMIKGMTEP